MSWEAWNEVKAAGCVEWNLKSHGRDHGLKLQKYATGLTLKTSQLPLLQIAVLYTILIFFSLIHKSELTVSFGNMKLFCMTPSTSLNILNKPCGAHATFVADAFANPIQFICFIFHQWCNCANKPCMSFPHIYHLKSNILLNNQRTP